MDMIAKKPMTYASRRLKVGDSFQARSRGHARVLTAIGKARLDIVTSPAPPPQQRAPIVPPAPPAPVDTPAPPPASDQPRVDIAALRVAYEKAFGKKPFNGWKAPELTAKLAEQASAE